MIKIINNIFGKRLTIVTYHRVTDKQVNSIYGSLPYLFISQSQFEKHLEFFKEHYKVISFRELKSYYNNNSIPWNCLIITFDDGYADNYEYAYPLLKKLCLPFMIFLTSARIDANHSKPFWWDRAYYYFRKLNDINKEHISKHLDHRILSLINDFDNDPSRLFSDLNTWRTDDIEKLLDQIQEKYNFNGDNLSKDNRMLGWNDLSGMSEYMDPGSHTHNHYNLVELEKQQQLNELYESKRIIEYNTGREVYAVALPHGNVNEDLVELIGEAGYEFSVTCTKGVNGLKDKFRLKRINLWEGTACISDNKYSKGYLALKLLGI